MPPTLETERLRLRPFRLDDAEAMFAGWTGDDEVTKYLTWPTHKSVEDTKALLARWVAEYERPERLNFAIVLKEEEKLIGGIDVVRYEDGCPVLGYNLSRPYWGRGVMTEACRRLLDYLFSQGYAEVRRLCRGADRRDGRKRRLKARDRKMRRRIRRYRGGLPPAQGQDREDQPLRLPGKIIKTKRGTA